MKYTKLLNIANHILPSSFSNVQIRAKSIPERSKVTSPSRTFDKEQQQQEINKAPVKLLPSEQTEIVEKGQTNSQNNFKVIASFLKLSEEVC